jgi:hypothetical protein
MYTLAFERLFLAGKIRRHSALRILKMWGFLSCLAEADVTLGVAEHIAKRFDISPTELEEPMRMLEDPPPHVRYVVCPLLPQPLHCFCAVQVLRKGAGPALEQGASKRDQ